MIDALLICGRSAADIPDRNERYSNRRAYLYSLPAAFYHGNVTSPQDPVLEDFKRSLHL
jgi:hypothetical protein